MATDGGYEHAEWADATEHAEGADAAGSPSFHPAWPGGATDIVITRQSASP